MSEQPTSNPLRTALEHVRASAQTGHGNGVMISFAAFDAVRAALDGTAGETPQPASNPPDIVARLRESAVEFYDNGNGWVDHLKQEAADEIERLRDALVKTGAAMKHAADMADRYEAAADETPDVTEMSACSRCGHPVMWHGNFGCIASDCKPRCMALSAADHSSASDVCQGCDGTGGPNKNCAGCRGTGRKRTADGDNDGR